MFLYKYIDFDNVHWSFPIASRKLHFSSIAELKGVNDLEEFDHIWSYPSYFFTHYGAHFSDSYDRLLKNSRVLCLGKNLNQTCWNTFIRSGNGICYEFRFNKVTGDVTSDHVKYCESKAINVPEYILQKLRNEELGNLLGSARELGHSELAKILSFLKTDQSLNSLFESHIYHEMAFKKKMVFRKEKEYRFIHIVDPVGPIIPQVQLKDSKASFADLGLHLTRIYTNNIEKVKNEAQDRFKCSIPSFLR
jgi:hypothetical protein